jgi:hypothetical protein
MYYIKPVLNIIYIYYYIIQNENDIIKIQYKILNLNILNKIKRCKYNIYILIELKNKNYINNKNKEKLISYLRELLFIILFLIKIYIKKRN